MPLSVKARQAMEMINTAKKVDLANLQAGQVWALKGGKYVLITHVCDDLGFLRGCRMSNRTGAAMAQGGRVDFDHDTPDMCRDDLAYRVFDVTPEKLAQVFQAIRNRIGC